MKVLSPAQTQSQIRNFVWTTMCGPDEYRYSDARPMLLSQFYVIVYDVMILISVLIG